MNWRPNKYQFLIDFWDGNSLYNSFDGFMAY